MHFQINNYHIIFSDDGNFLNDEEERAFEEFLQQQHPH